ncbi:MAG: ArsC/Spx/MgsR family protein [Gammaproteobacteria bacterium]
MNAPPDPQEIERTLKLLRMQPREIMRTFENEYRTPHSDDPGLPRTQLIAALHTNPILIRRPIVFTNGKACIGRPPAAVLEIL